MRVFLLLILSLAGLVACDSPRTQLDEADLEAAARRLTSLDAEALLFARQVAQGNATRAFALSHRQALVQESLKVDKELAKPTRDALQTRRDELAMRNTVLRDRVLHVETSK